MTHVIGCVAKDNNALPVDADQRQNWRGKPIPQTSRLYPWRMFLNFRIYSI